LEAIFSTAGQRTTGDEQRLVLDADALNTLSKAPALLQKIPAFSILTPHPAEFDRLFGKPGSDFERMRVAQQ
jgi:NAD(P)H-hydrate repair Nnr-like enzyme with NAD(P)H-hydrate dehydratase domain